MLSKVMHFNKNTALKKNSYIQLKTIISIWPQLISTFKWFRGQKLNIL